MKILFVSTVPIFPPSDGVRIPPAHYLSGLAKNHEIDFLLLDSGSNASQWQNDCATTAAKVSRFWSVPMRRQSQILSFVREALSRGPYYGAWTISARLPAGMVSTHYEVILGCTPVAIALLARHDVRILFRGNPRWIAAMSDLYSLAMYRLARSASKSHSLVGRFTYLIRFGMRSNMVARNEMHMLAAYDQVFVQTDKEHEWIVEKSGKVLAERTVCLPNAVADELFELPVVRTRKSIVFVGNLSSLYGERFHWFIQNVWAKVRHKNTDLTLSAVGKGASPSLRRVMAEAGIQYIPFIENLSDIYSKHDILVAPIFKGYGLINKVVEAMASGCVVVGDATAFNGIDGFIPGTHGFVANSAQEFIAVLLNDLQDSGKLDDIRESARRVMQAKFRWSERIQAIEHALRP